MTSDLKLGLLAGSVGRKFGLEDMTWDTAVSPMPIDRAVIRSFMVNSVLLGIH